MTRREVPPLHEIAKLEYKYRLFYFLFDMGLKSALVPAREVSDAYMDAMAQVSIGQACS